MKRWIEYLAAILVVLVAVDTTAMAAPVDKPNIILIFADDQGWRDAGFAGSTYYETPYLDRLAAEGMVFRHAYAAAGNCAPSRACLLSGQYTPRHGVFAVGSTERGPVELMRMLPIRNTGGLAADEFTMAKALKSAGYTTGMFGKWHLDGRGRSTPEQHFDVVKMAASGWRGNVKDDLKGIFSITAAACEFIEANRDRPFFAYLPHYAIHSPLQARSEVIQRFESKQPDGVQRNAKNAACMAELDAGVGQLVEKLAALGLEENTLIVYTSDNGGVAESQEPLRGRKGSYYEGGIRVPMVARWPAVIKPGSVCDVPVINVDLYPTFVAAAGGTVSADRPLDGESLLPLFRGEPALQRQGIFWHFPGYLDNAVPRGRDRVFRMRPVSVIRKGDWKLHLYHEEWQLDGGRAHLATNNAVEFYNLVSDPGEHHNVAHSETQRRDELLDDLLAWIDRVKAPLPTQPNPRFDANAGKTRPKAK